VYVKPTAPRSIGGVLDDSIRLYRAVFAPTWRLALAAQLLVAVPSLYTRLHLLEGAPVSPQTVLSLYRSSGFWLPYLVCGIATIGLYNAITLELSAAFHGAGGTAGQAVSAGYRLLPRVVLLSTVVLVAALAAGIVFAMAMQAPALIRLVLGLAAMPFIIFVLGRLYLAHVALIADDLRVLKAIETSWLLTRGNWWRGATIYTVILLVVLVFYFIVVFAAGLLMFAFGPRSVTGTVLTELISVTGISLVTPLVSAGLVAIYNDFKLRIEGADLADRVNALSLQ
jgi:hypothetical protein